jgi:hypothetical protein
VLILSVKRSTNKLVKNKSKKILVLKYRIATNLDADKVMGNEDG